MSFLLIDFGEAASKITILPKVEEIVKAQQEAQDADVKNPPKVGRIPHCTLLT